jgi:hypothetical protein
MTNVISLDEYKANQIDYTMLDEAWRYGSLALDSMNDLYTELDRATCAQLMVYRILSEAKYAAENLDEENDAQEVLDFIKESFFNE